MLWIVFICVGYLHYIISGQQLFEGFWIYECYYAYLYGDQMFAFIEGNCTKHSPQIYVEDCTR